MKKVIVCTNHRANPVEPSCAERNSRNIANMLEQGITENRIAIKLERFNCLGRCEMGPNLKMVPDGSFCHGVQMEDVPALLEKIRTFANENPSSGLLS